MSYPEGTKIPIQTLTTKSESFNWLDSKVLFIGKRGSGKTTLIKSIYNEIKDSIDDLYYFSSIRETFEGIKTMNP